VVSVKASLDGNGAIALGNVVGSNICNIALILGVAALIKPVRIEAQVIRREIPILIFASILLWAMLAGGELQRWMGLLLTVGLVAYIAFSYGGARAEKNEAVREEFAEALPAPEARRAWVDVLFVLVGLAMLLFGANLFVDGAVAVAERFGVSQAVIGLTIVAVGTSLPELATSIVAAFKGEGDIAVGNAVGSSIFNILCILGVAALIRPMATTGISMVDLAVMTACAVLVMPMMRSGFCLNRWEGIFLLAVYVGYLYYVIP
jgi:cation:H+ antiporter